MKNFFMKDSVLKIISFVIAVLLWVYIIAVVDPSINLVVKDIPIRYLNQDELEKHGLCLLNGDKATVELKISGSRKRLADIDNKNIYATVDLATINKTGTFSLPIAISIPYEYNEIVNKKPYNANVVVDKIVSADKEIKVYTTGSVANGYIAGVAVPGVESVVLTGPSALVDKIGNVGVEIDYDGRSAEISDVVGLFFLDRDGKRISSSDETNSLVSKGTDKITVNCPVYKLKNVPVTADIKTQGDMSDFKISVQPNNVTIYADSEILDNIQEISTEEIKLDTIDNKTQDVKLVIPEGVFFRDGIKEVTIKAEKRN